MKYQVQFSPTARQEILEAFDYIRTDRQAPINAARWLDGMIQAINDLTHYPEGCALARENDEFKEDLRQLVYKSHRVIFDVAGDTVRIHRVVHTARRNLEPGGLAGPDREG